MFSRSHSHRLGLTVEQLFLYEQLFKEFESEIEHYFKTVYDAEGAEEVYRYTNIYKICDYSRGLRRELIKRSDNTVMFSVSVDVQNNKLDVERYYE